jgi:hypothetical protein
MRQTSIHGYSKFEALIDKVPTYMSQNPTRLHEPMIWYLVSGDYRLTVFWKTQSHGCVAPHDWRGCAIVTTRIVTE